MKIFRGLLKTFSILLILGTVLTLLLTLLTGGTQTSILKKFYWLETDCSEYPGSPIQGRCRWTSYGLCRAENGSNVDCTHAAAAYPFSPSRNFNSNDNLPKKFVDNKNYYYYTSRIGWGFTLVGTAFVFFSWIPFFTLLYLHDKFKSVEAVFWILWSLSILFVVPGVALLTAAYVKGRNVFNDNGNSAHLGTKPMAVAWTSVFLLFFSIPFFVFATKDWISGRYSLNRNRVNATNEGDYMEKGKKSRTSWFFRKPKNPQYGTENGASNANYLTFTPVKEPNTKEVRAQPVAIDGDTL